MKEKKTVRYSRLTLAEVQAIYVMRSKRVGIRAIGRALGRSPSAVSNVLRKYRHPYGRVWLAMTALEKAKYAFDKLKANRKRSGNHGHLKDSEVRGYVIRKLVDEQWSPLLIANKVQEDLPGKHVTARTIYNFVKHDRKDLKQYLQERGKPRKQRVAHRRGRFKQGAPEKRSIHERPAAVAERREIGHWEADTIVSKRGGSRAILTLRERVTRQRHFALIPNLKASTVQPVIRAFIERTPAELLRSITFDNGSEFAVSELSKLERWYPWLRIYYCDPYAAWQRGAVEHANWEFRWYFPKGTDFATVSKQQVREVEAKLNRRPMQCLGFRSSEEITQRFLHACNLVQLAA